MSTHWHGEVIDGPHKGRRIYSEREYIELDEPNEDGKTLTRHTYIKREFWRNGVLFNYCWTNRTGTGAPHDNPKRASRVSHEQ